MNKKFTYNNNDNANIKKQNGHGTQRLQQQDSKKRNLENVYPKSEGEIITKESIENRKKKFKVNPPPSTPIRNNSSNITIPSSIVSTPTTTNTNSSSSNGNSQITVNDKPKQQENNIKVDNIERLGEKHQSPLLDKRSKEKEKEKKKDKKNNKSKKDDKYVYMYECDCSECSGPDSNSVSSCSTYSDFTSSDDNYSDSDDTDSLERSVFGNRKDGKFEDKGKSKGKNKDKDKDKSKKEKKSSKNNTKNKKTNSNSTTRKSTTTIERETNFNDESDSDYESDQDSKVPIKSNIKIRKRLSRTTAKQNVEKSANSSAISSPISTSNNNSDSDINIESDSGNSNTSSLVKGGTGKNGLLYHGKPLTIELVEQLIKESRVSMAKIVELIQKLRDKSFKYITKNLYVERREKVEFEIYPCNCFEQGDDGDNCGEECLNRKSFYECIDGHCDLNEQCQNQRFQRKQYADLHPFSAGPKGWGLKTKQPIKKDQFVVEYCGEVISKNTCMDRMTAAENEKFFYFLTLDSKECIDATNKGNISRFINHSCDPNCRTQKWTVKGEMKIGIFAIKDIAPGTEITFDYNFERFGAAKQPCYCESYNCRGFLGEKSSNSSTQYHSDDNMSLDGDINYTEENNVTSDSEIYLHSHMEVMDHKNHVRFLLNEAIDSSNFTYQSDLSLENLNVIVRNKKVFLQRNLNLLKQYYLNLYQSLVKPQSHTSTPKISDNVEKNNGNGISLKGKKREKSILKIIDKLSPNK
ncbi:SET domain-containing protein [Tieghemostelium lacteum]|uniref:SET domain-containing protein n=1 Tax=Tieghemostelium lacteum TaxID=361077 RepID=A0A151ZEA0_TIELA|nr:SET domain-containing protein [Tieghemostelium lacteum]|eukprot:KYQ92214.1 SET domain-containing protein [Tieghemostelium lacteum]